MCSAGWALLILACSPIFSGGAFAVLLAWGSAGVLVLSVHVGLEIQTVRGMVRWVGLFLVWPLTMHVAEELFLDSGQWPQPPKATP